MEMLGNGSPIVCSTWLTLRLRGRVGGLYSDLLLVRGLVHLASGDRSRSDSLKEAGTCDVL